MLEGHGPVALPEREFVRPLQACAQVDRHRYRSELLRKRLRHQQLQWRGKREAGRLGAATQLPLPDVSLWFTTNLTRWNGRYHGPAKSFLCGTMPPPAANGIE